MLGLVFFLASIYAVIVSVAFTAYYLA